MIKLTATSKGFAGEVSIVYGEDNVLLLIDFLQAELSGKQAAWMLPRIPAIYEAEVFEKISEEAGIAFISSDYEVSFQQFWNAYGLYGNKVNRKRALTAWGKLTTAEQVLAFVGVKAYFKYLKRSGYRNAVDPARYLTERYWENDWTKAR